MIIDWRNRGPWGFGAGILAISWGRYGGLTGAMIGTITMAPALAAALTAEAELDANLEAEPALSARTEMERQ